MKCFDLLTYQKFIHGELKEKERIRVETHLSSCKKCRIKVEEMKKEESKLKELFIEEEIDLTSLILEKIYPIEMTKEITKINASYLLVFLSFPFIASFVLEFLRSIPFLGNLLSPLYYIPSIFFAVINKVLTVNIEIFLFESSILSILISALFLFRNLRIKTETI